MTIGAAILALCVAQAPDVVSLVRQLGAERFDAREAAMEALIRVGWPAVPAVRAALHSADFEISARARRLLLSDLAFIEPCTLIDITVVGEPELSRSGIFVPPDGYDYVPYIGRVQLAGRTPEVLKQELESRYSELLKHPLVIVTLRRAIPWEPELPWWSSLCLPTGA